MINYSLSKHSNPMDADAVKKYYAVPQCTEVIDIQKFAQHIQDHGCVYSRADIQAILIMAVDCIHELLLKGYKVQLGELGDFWLKFKSRGKLNAADFVAANDIKKVNTRFSPGSLLKNLKEEAEFNQVPNRKIQAATLKNLNGTKTQSTSTAKKGITYTVAVTASK